ncbi:hypothetical protein LTR86_003384 [Recurvomyces mirabilis]|nr:hypothetical protein LTR86_003384 [Recurvomyces mirabilis]
MAAIKEVQQIPNKSDMPSYQQTEGQYPKRTTSRIAELRNAFNQPVKPLGVSNAAYAETKRLQRPVNPTGALSTWLENDGRADRPAAATARPAVRPASKEPTLLDGVTVIYAPVPNFSIPTPRSSPTKTKKPKTQLTALPPVYRPAGPYNGSPYVHGSRATTKTKNMRRRTQSSEFTVPEQMVRRHDTISLLSSSASEWARDTEAEHREVLQAGYMCETKMAFVERKKRELASILEKLEEVETQLGQLGDVDDVRAIKPSPAYRPGKSPHKRHRDSGVHISPTQRRRKGHRINRSASSRMSSLMARAAVVTPQMSAASSVMRSPRTSTDESMQSRLTRMSSRGCQSRMSLLSLSSFSSFDTVLTVSSRTAVSTAVSAAMKPVPLYRGIPTLQSVPARGNSRVMDDSSPGENSSPEYKQSPALISSEARPANDVFQIQRLSAPEDKGRLTGPYQDIVILTPPSSTARVTTRPSRPRPTTISPVTPLQDLPSESSSYYSNDIEEDGDDYFEDPPSPLQHYGTRKHHHHHHHHHHHNRTLSARPSPEVEKPSPSKPLRLTLTPPICAESPPQPATNSGNTTKRSTPLVRAFKRWVTPKSSVAAVPATASAALPQRASYATQPTTSPTKRRGFSSLFKRRSCAPRKLSVESQTQQYQSVAPHSVHVYGTRFSMTTPPQQTGPYANRPYHELAG